MAIYIIPLFAGRPLQVALCIISYLFCFVFFSIQVPRVTALVCHPRCAGSTSTTSHTSLLPISCTKGPETAVHTSAQPSGSHGRRTSVDSETPETGAKRDG